VNVARGNLRACAVRAPSFGSYREDMLGDLATITGASLISSKSGLEMKDVTLEHLGTCKSVVVTRSNTTIVGAPGSKEDIDTRCDGIRAYLEDPTLSDGEQNMLRERLSKLVGGVAILRVGGATEVELRERRDRVEDSLNATRAAVEEGILPGGGVALVRAAKSLDALKSSDPGEAAGVSIVKRACEEPLRQILLNAGHEPPTILEKIRKKKNKNQGYDAATGNFADMIDAGILDPVKVTRCALENASSVASLMLTVDTAIVVEKTARDDMPVE